MDVPVAIEQKICRLHVAVDDTLLVRGIDCLRSLLEPREDTLGRLSSLRSQDVLERSAAEVLHDDVRTFVMLADVEDRHRVTLSGEPRCRQRLARESCANRFITGISIGEHLDRHRTAERRIGCAVDVGHAAASNLLGAPVARRQHVHVDRHRSSHGR